MQVFVHAHVSAHAHSRSHLDDDTMLPSVTHAHGHSLLTQPSFSTCKSAGSDSAPYCWNTDISAFRASPISTHPLYSDESALNMVEV